MKGVLVLFTKLLLIGILILAYDTCLAQTWRGIVLLQSSRTDVKAAFGEPTSEGKYVSSYETAEQKFDVYYASDPQCGGGLTNSWKVPLDTVVGIRILPKKEVDLPATVYESISYTKVADVKDKNIFYFIDPHHGLRYTALLDPNQRWVQLSLDIFPEDNSPLRCSSAQSSGGARQGPPFEQYGEISSASELAILDNFSIEIKRDEKMTGSVVVYTSSSRTRLEAQSKLEEIKRYLFDVRDVPRKRVRFSIAGPIDSSMVELYLRRR